MGFWVFLAFAVVSRWCVLFLVFCFVGLIVLLAVKGVTKKKRKKKKKGNLNLKFGVGLTVKKQKGRVVCVRIVLTSCEWAGICWAYKKKGVKKLSKGNSNLNVTRKKPNPKYPLVGP